MEALRPSASVLKISPVTVALVALALLALAAGCGPTNGLPELTGEFAYVANYSDSIISVFSIDSTTGALTFVQSMPVDPTFTIFGLALHWSNEFLYSTIDEASAIESFDIGDGISPATSSTTVDPFPLSMDRGR
jgi:DNA-binding beta-propeller fold protein YncE